MTDFPNLEERKLIHKWLLARDWEPASLLGSLCYMKELTPPGIAMTMEAALMGQIKEDLKVQFEIGERDL